MGCSQASGEESMSINEQRDAFKLSLLGNRSTCLERFRIDALCDFTILIGSLAKERSLVRDALRNAKDIRLDRCLGAMIGLAVGDALGAPLEFAALRYGSQALQDMGQAEIWARHPEYMELRPVRNEHGYNYFGLKPGQWTDDTSMALCLADSLLVCRGFNAMDLRLRFLNWWQLGYNNAFSKDIERRQNGMGSCGLGGNISESFCEFEKTPAEFTSAGNRLTSGNGSVMRLAPCAIFAHRALDKAMLIAEQQSKTTHQGDEAAECCRLLAYLLVGAFQWREAETRSSGELNSSVLQARVENGNEIERVDPALVVPEAKTKPKAKSKASHTLRAGSPISATAKQIGRRSRRPCSIEQSPTAVAKTQCAGAFKRWLLDEWCSNFPANNYSVSCLATSCMESQLTAENVGSFEAGDWVVVADFISVQSTPMDGGLLSVGTLLRGTRVEITAIMSGFGNITFPIKGWISPRSREGEFVLERADWQLARNWNWKVDDFRYATSRAEASPDYIGSYVMDNLSMALHCVWTTDSFRSAVLKASNLCGDADTVAAVVGQIAGAIYGATAVPSTWLDHLEKWDGGDVAFKAWLLYQSDDSELLNRCLNTLSDPD